MKRYVKMLGKMYESDIGEWVLFQDHHEDYIRRWERTNIDNATFILKQYTDLLLINKLKLVAYSLVTLLILSLVIL